MMGIRKYGKKFPVSEMQKISWPDEKLPNCSVLVDFILEITESDRPITNVTLRFYRPRGA
jgi:hypothetical protein